jgi:hypothetical protein
MKGDAERVRRMFAASVPPDRVTDVVAWAEANVTLPGSTRSTRFSADVTPWTREIIRRIDDGETQRLTFVKPIQSGGSVAGEIAICYWVANKAGGDVQMNWQNDDHAEARWQKRIERILKACPPVMARWGGVPDRTKMARCQWILPHMNLICQGVFTERRVASDTITYQVNEEVHDEEGWVPGRLDQAFGRLTAAWDGVAIVISNAGKEGSELHKAFESGTHQEWEVLCPGCGKYHRMRTKWEDGKPELGGLRYDSDGCKMENGTYNYTKLARTIRYQFPCGHEMPDDIALRRALSLSGRYGEPQNPGARLSNRSYRLDAVAVDYIPWIQLIEEKHKALRSLKYGDFTAWQKYVRERECMFVKPEDRPRVQEIVLAPATKSRDGIPDRDFRFGTLDRQQGSIQKGELPHWWGVIRDFRAEVDGTIRSLLVWEGKLLTDEDAAGIMRDHSVAPTAVVCDSGDDTAHVYRFCLRYGFHAIKGEPRDMFAHDDGSRRIFSPERPLHLMCGAPPSKEDPRDEPQFWLYSKPGIRERLHWFRTSPSSKWETPSDVSQDYIAHMDAERLEQRNVNGRRVSVWVQYEDRNDLFVCEAYAAMLADYVGMIGATPLETT